MEKTPHKYVTVAYELYADNAEGVHELIEKAPAEHPYQFISGLGVTLDAFEANIAGLEEGSDFDFTLSVDDAYGPYVDEHVLDLDKKTFCVDGRFDKDTIYPGAVLPLVNADGNHFDGLVLDVKENSVRIDLNHPLAGKALHFKGKVVTMRPATDKEIQGMINMMSGEGCGCGCEDCGDECHHHHDHEGDGGCCGGHCHHH